MMLIKNPLMLAAVCFLFSPLFFSPVMARQTNLASPLGINTNEAMDVDTSVPFVDLFRMALPFKEAHKWLGSGKIEYDKNGWPKNLHGGKAGTRFVGNMPQQSIPAGVYTVLYKGKGKIKYGGNARLIRHYPNKDIISLRGDHKGKITATLTIVESDPKNYIRNIQVIMPGGICKNQPFYHVRNPRKCARNNPFLAYATHAKSIVFNPDYLLFMKNFRVVRFMNMAGVTRSSIGSWEQRPKVEQATWGGREGKRGVPLEIMVKLANTLGLDPWFNLPHRANNDFVRQYARYVSRHLDPKLKAYIEYTNEAWNGIFSQTHQIQQIGTHLGLDKNKANAGYKYYSQRSVEIFKIWEQEFKSIHRLVRVMGGMTTNIPLTHLLLGYKEAYKHVDAFAIAPYFHATQAAQKRIKSVNSVFALLVSPQNKYSIPNTLRLVSQQAKTVARYGVDLVAYEGGQHLVVYKTHGMKESSNAYIIQANKDNRMSKLYYRFLEGWRKAGGKLFVAFSSPRSYNWIGSWGIKEYITQNIAEAPKYRALIYFQNKNPCWWHGCSRAGGLSRMKKPTDNPGKSVMAKRFKPYKTAKARILATNTHKQQLKRLYSRKKARRKQIKLVLARKAAKRKQLNALNTRRALNKKRIRIINSRKIAQRKRQQALNIRQERQKQRDDRFIEKIAMQLQISKYKSREQMNRGSNKNPLFAF